MSHHIIVMIADLLVIGLFVISYFVIFDDTDQKEIERKKKVDALIGKKD